MHYLSVDHSLDIYDDFTCGSDYLRAVQTGQIAPGDTVVLFSIDGAQLYKNKKSTCWMYIWVILNLAPDKRYKVKHVLPGGFIGGPLGPKNRDSFLLPGLYHVAALQREGLIIWDGSRQIRRTSNIFAAFFTADSVGLADINGWVGHHGKCGCRYMCGLPGRHKPVHRRGDGTHYFPAMLRPHNYTVHGCDHPDIDVTRLPSASPEKYRDGLQSVVECTTQTQYTARRLETGICKPAIFDGLTRLLPIPNCFCGDLMHHTALNLPDLILGLFRGKIDCDPDDDRSTWDWATLRDNDWQAHGQMVADAVQYIPGHYGRTPRNPAKKISSGFKAAEFLIYIYGLGPALLYRFIPQQYWQHYCKLVRGIRLMLQRSISRSDIRTAHKYLLEYVLEYELLYYQRRADRLHFVRPALHLLTHYGPETNRVGPLALLAQWVMERTIGNLGAELRQPSNPFANLAQRGLLRSQINALKAMFPDLEPDKSAMPAGSLDIDDGYVLLRKRDKAAHAVRECEADSIRTYLTDALGDAAVLRWSGTVIRWARVRLPNGQVARSLWGESDRKRRPRRARNVTVNFLFLWNDVRKLISLFQLTLDNVIRVAEVQYYFAISMNDDRKYVALVSLLDPPDARLYESSHGTLSVHEYNGDDNLIVVDIKSIRSSIALVPFPPPDNPTDADRNLFFMFDDLGFDVAEMDVDADVGANDDDNDDVSSNDDITTDLADPPV